MLLVGPLEDLSSELVNHEVLAFTAGGGGGDGGGGGTDAFVCLFLRLFIVCASVVLTTCA